MRKYVQAARDDKGRLIAKGMLKYGVKIGSELHKEFVLREALTGDVMDAELNASTSNPLNFNIELLRHQLVSIGTFDGALDIGMLRTMRTADTNILRAAQAELDLAGEAEQ